VKSHWDFRHHPVVAEGKLHLVSETDASERGDSCCKCRVDGVASVNDVGHGARCFLAVDADFVNSREKGGEAEVVDHFTEGLVFRASARSSLALAIVVRIHVRLDVRSLSAFGCSMGVAAVHAVKVDRGAIGRGNIEARTTHERKARRSDGVAEDGAALRAPHGRSVHAPLVVRSALERKRTKGLTDCIELTGQRAVAGRVQPVSAAGRRRGRGRGLAGWE
jgi:hypothetical protein